ncbi:MAG: GumC family protein [Sphingomonadaceae bacterium]
MNFISQPEPQQDFNPLPGARAQYPRAAEAVQPQAEPIIRKWIAIIQRRRWYILGVITAALLTAVVVTLLMTRQYTASTTLEIARDDAKIVNIQGVEPQVGSLDQEFYQTQYGLLKARSLAEAVVVSLKLHEDRRFLDMMDIETANTLFASTPGGTLPARSRADRLSQSIKALLDRVAIAPVRASRLVTISFESPDPDLSARIANTWADQFIERNLARRFDATSYARKFLEERLADVRNRLEVSERQLVTYAAANRLITVGSPSGDAGQRTQERSVVEDTLVALNEQLATARGMRIAAESRAAQGGGASTESLSNNAINVIRQRRAEVAGEYARLKAQFEPEYPPLAALAAQLGQLDASIASEERRVRTAVQGQFQQAVTQERALAERVRTLEDTTLDQRRRSIQFNIYQREVDTNRELYNGLLQRFKEIGIAGGVGTNNIAVVDRAISPTKPSAPRPLLNIVLALLAGTALGFALAFLLEQIDEAVTDASTIEQTLKIPVLGTIPRIANEDPLAELADRKSPVSEAYLSMETALKFSTPEGMPRSILITSTQPGEGKSTTSVALSTTLARLGRRVLLVDADMRSPSLHGIFGVTNTQGFSTVLSGNGDLKALILDTDQDGLWLLPAGPNPPNAAELLSSIHLAEAVAAALALFDVVIFDAPPVMALADAPLAASRIAGTIVVIEANSTRLRPAGLMLQRLRAANANIVGAVLTKFDAKRSSQYGYGYDYGYGYGQKTDAAPST